MRRCVRLDSTRYCLRLSRPTVSATRRGSAPQASSPHHWPRQHQTPSAAIAQRVAQARCSPRHAHRSMTLCAALTTLGAMNHSQALHATVDANLMLLPQCASQREVPPLAPPTPQHSALQGDALWTPWMAFRLAFLLPSPPLVLPSSARFTVATIKTAPDAVRFGTATGIFSPHRARTCRATRRLRMCPAVRCRDAPMMHSCSCVMMITVQLTATLCGSARDARRRTVGVRGTAATVRARRFLRLGHHCARHT
mmetsp:Transcript_21341/g.55709  ORF Transcript_21341/g.55709 Transcript_21341/m.55709 type:complete len:253 (-) Transcript_21341:328-1086(-)